MSQRDLTTVYPLSQEVGWVLSNAREYASLGRSVSMSRLARTSTPSVHRSQVGRWETGQSGISRQQVRQYELLLGLPEGQLSTTIDLFARTHERVRAAPHLGIERGETWWEDTDALLDKALGDERMTGVEWSELSANLSLDPHAFVRGADWVRLLRRLVLEANYRIGLDFLLRDEALGRLVAHPRSSRAIDTILDETLGNPSAAYREAVSLAVNAAGSTGVATILRHLDDPVCESALWAVLWSTRLILRCGRLTPAQVAHVGARAVSLLEGDAPSDRVRRQAATLLASVDGPARGEAVALLSRTGRARLAHLMERGTVLAPAELATVDAEIRGRLAASFGPYERMPATLRHLLDVITSRTSLDERGDALGILLLSPQGAVVGRTYASALRWGLAESHGAVVAEALAVLSWLVQPDDVGTLLELAEDPSTEPTIALLALQAVGNIPSTPRTDPGTPDREAVAARVLASALRHVARPGPDPLSTSRGHLYALGMYARFDLVEAVRAAAAATEGSAATVWRRAAEVWLDLPECVRPPAP